MTELKKNFTGNLNDVYGEESWNEYFERKLNQIVDKLNHLELNGEVSISQPYHLGRETKSIGLKLTRKGMPFKLKPVIERKEQEVRKLSNSDWLTIMQHYKMLFDGFQRADWSKDDVRESIASAMIKKTKEFFEENYPDLIEVKKRPILNKDDIR